LGIFEIFSISSTWFTMWRLKDIRFSKILKVFNGMCTSSSLFCGVINRGISYIFMVILFFDQTTMLWTPFSGSMWFPCQNCQRPCQSYLISVAIFNDFLRPNRSKWGWLRLFLYIYIHIYLYIYIHIHTNIYIY
jgi:hypothetical protein